MLSPVWVDSSYWRLSWFSVIEHDWVDSYCWGSYWSPRTEVLFHQGSETVLI